MPHDMDPTRRRLDRRPEATSFAIDDLLLAVRDGRVRLPPFARKFMWDDGDRLMLFDSIYRGFPIGTLLFWRRSAPAEAVQFASVKIDAEARDDALWVLDGQQRVTTLVTALLHEAGRGERAAHFDLTREEFVWLRVRGGEGVVSARFVPVSALLDSERLMNWLIERGRELEAHERAVVLEAGERLRAYRVPGYVVESRDETLVLEVFERTNRSGRRLPDKDVLLAISDLGRRSQDVQEVGQGATFPHWGSFDEVTTLRALQAVEGLPVDHPLPAGLGAERMRHALGRARAALARVVSFLRDRAHLPHEGLNPYALPVVVLARFFDTFPDPSERTLVLLRRWVWRGLCGLQLAGTGVQLRQHLRAVASGEEHTSVQRLLQRTPPAAAPSLADISDVRIKTARTKIHACAMISLGPRDLRTDAPLSPYTFATAESFPFARLFARAAHDGLAARLIYPPLAPDELRRLVLDASAEALDSHAITSEARDALARDDRDAFLAIRAQTLSAHLDAFFSRMAEWGADDSPPLAALAPEEDD